MEYQVQSGDTIAKVTNMMNISWSKLQKLNPHAVGRSKRNGNWFLKEGMKINDGQSFASVLDQTRKASKPEPVVETPRKSAKYFDYTIKPGDTLWALAVKKFHVHMEDIIKDNGIKNPHRIQPGQKIRIHTPEFQPEQVITASWYGANFHGKQMADGKPYNMYASTIAHKELPLGTRV